MKNVEVNYNMLSYRIASVVIIYIVSSIYMLNAKFLLLYAEL